MKSYKKGNYFPPTTSPQMKNVHSFVGRKHELWEPFRRMKYTWKMLLKTQGVATMLVQTFLFLLIKFVYQRVVSTTH